VLARYSKWVVVATLSLTLGFHWAILQSVAWVGMFVDFSCQGSLTEAVSKTFDGQHPCPLCKLVRAGKNSDGKSTFLQSVTKCDLFAERGTIFLFPPKTESLFFSPSFMQQRVESPALPPPRAFLS
jgi:hypothetical protein